MKKRLFKTTMAAMAISAALIGASSAATLRIASQGDATSLDPHSHNESFTNYFLANIYEGLVARDRDFCFVTNPHQH